MVTGLLTASLCVPYLAAPCLCVCVPCRRPSLAPHPPSGGLWLHEIKHDGFRVIARKNDKRVRLYSPPGNNLTYRFPLLSNCAI
jgi:hypothetical protein